MLVVLHRPLAIDIGGKTERPSPTKYIRHGTSKNLNANLDLRLQVSRRDNAAQERELEALRIRRAERQRVAAVATRKLA